MAGLQINNKMRFLSPLEIMENNPEIHRQIQTDINISFAGLLLENHLYQIAVNYIRSSPGHILSSQNEKIWFLLKIQTLSGLEDFENCKQMLLVKIKNSENDSLLLGALQYVIWCEHRVSQGYPLDQSQPGSKIQADEMPESITPEEFSRYLDKFDKSCNDALVLWQQGNRLSNIIKWQEDSDLADIIPGIYSEKLLKVFSQFGHGRILKTFLKFKNYYCQTFHRIGQSLGLLGDPSPLSITGRYRLETMFFNTGYRTTRGGLPIIETKRNMSALYAASLLESQDLNDCMRYLSHQPGVTGTALYDMEGFPLAMADNSSNEFIWHAPYFTSKFIGDLIELERTRFNGFNLQITSGSNEFYCIRLIDDTILTVSGLLHSQEQYHRLEDRIIIKIKNILKVPSDLFTLDICLQTIVKLANAKIAVLLSSRGNILSSSTAADHFEANYRDMLAWLSLFINQMKNKIDLGTFEQFVIILKSGIIVIQEVDKNYLVLIIDQQTPVGMIKWTLSKVVPAIKRRNA